jgi:hypothetical protein
VAEIAHVRSLGLAELHTLWRLMFRSAPPQAFTKDLAALQRPLPSHMLKIVATGLKTNQSQPMRLQTSELARNRHKSPSAAPALGDIAIKALVIGQAFALDSDAGGGVGLRQIISTKWPVHVSKLEQLTYPLGEPGAQPSCRLGLAELRGGERATSSLLRGDRRARPGQDRGLQAQGQYLELR